MTIMFRAPFGRPRHAVRSAINSTALSRRQIMPLFAGVAAVATVFTVKPARGQETAWREFRRDDLGFRVELPGEPKVEVTEDDHKDIWIRSVDAHVEYEQITLGANCIEWKEVIRADEHFALFHEGMHAAGTPVTRETGLEMNGFPAREFVGESNGINYIQREVVVGKLSISAAAFGEQSIHVNPAVRRFLESFQLLRSAR